MPGITPGHTLATTRTAGIEEATASGDRLDIGTATRWLAWSPTGRYLGWASGLTIVAIAQDDVALLRLGDAEATPVLRVPGLGIARWAPDDARAVAERDGRIFVLRLGAGSALQVANGCAPVWRPVPDRSGT